MADTAISDLAALTGANLASTDEFVVVDKSDTTMSADGTDKRMTATELAAGVGTLAGAYSDYTPTFNQSGALTTSSLFARYNQIGKRVHAIGRCTFSNAGTTNNAIRMSVPVNMHATLGANTAVLGVVTFTDSGTALYHAHALAVNGSTVEFYATHLTNGIQLGVTNGPAFAVASGDQLRWELTYEAA
jgi:hypothetical protein